MVVVRLMGIVQLNQRFRCAIVSCRAGFGLGGTTDYTDTQRHVRGWSYLNSSLRRLMAMRGVRAHVDGGIYLSLLFRLFRRLAIGSPPGSQIEQPGSYQ